MTNTAHEASVRGTGLPISPKMSMIICEEIRGKNLQSAKKILQNVLTMKKPIALRRFHKDLGHKPGMGPARYPVNASKQILQLLESLESNAENKGLNKDKLMICVAIANYAERRWHSGRPQPDLINREANIHYRRDVLFE